MQAQDHKHPSKREAETIWDLSANPQYSHKKLAKEKCWGSKTGRLLASQPTVRAASMLKISQDNVVGLARWPNS